MDRVKVTMEADTVKELSRSGYRLYGFKAVRNSDAAGRPLVWFLRTDYGTNTEIEWLPDRFQAYTSTNPIQEGQRIVAGFAVDIDLDQSLRVEAGGTGTVVLGGAETEIWIRNTTSQGYRTGISQALSDTVPRPVSVFPLRGNNLQKIEPLAQVLLILATELMEPGTVIDHGNLALFQVDNLDLAPGGVMEGILIDVAKAPGRQAEVSFHIDRGWAWEGSWAQKVEAGSDLVPLLIQND